jgi:DNA-binding transcriptional MocR family regulator
MRAEYAARRGVLVHALAEHAPSVRATAWRLASTP